MPFLSRLIVPGLLSVALAACVQVGSRPDAVVTGTLVYAPAGALPEPVSLRVTLLDADAAGGAEPVAEVDMGGATPPAGFTLQYDPRAIDPGRRYVLEAQLTGDGRLLLMTAGEFAVITLGNAAHVELTLRPPGEAAAAQ